MGRQHVDIPIVVEKWGESGLVKSYCRWSSWICFLLFNSTFAGNYTCSISSTIIYYSVEPTNLFVVRVEAVAMGRIWILGVNLNPQFAEEFPRFGDFECNYAPYAVSLGFWFSIVCCTVVASLHALASLSFGGPRFALLPIFESRFTCYFVGLTSLAIWLWFAGKNGNGFCSPGYDVNNAACFSGETLFWIVFSSDPIMFLDFIYVIERASVLTKVFGEHYWTPLRWLNPFENVRSLASGVRSLDSCVRSLASC